jgi:hypothetical protein
MSSPIRFSITTSACRVPSPSGQPVIARMCCSNWSTAQPACVQWPELCTRGAISFTMRPEGVTKSSTPITPT